MNGRIRLIGWTGLLSEVDWMKEAAQLSALVGVTGGGMDGHVRLCDAMHAEIKW